MGGQEVQNRECSGEIGLFVQLYIYFFNEQMSSMAEQALESGCLGSDLGSVLQEFLGPFYVSFPLLPTGLM